SIFSSGSSVFASIFSGSGAGSTLFGSESDTGGTSVGISACGTLSIAALVSIESIESNDSIEEEEGGGGGAATPTKTCWPEPGDFAGIELRLRRWERPVLMSPQMLVLMGPHVFVGTERGREERARCVQVLTLIAIACKQAPKANAFHSSNEGPSTI